MPIIKQILGSYFRKMLMFDKILAIACMDLGSMIACGISQAGGCTVIDLLNGNKGHAKRWKLTYVK